jgi:hypothetical protein
MILALAREHQLVTRLTSLVAVDQTPSRPAGAEAPPKDGVAPDGLGAYSRRGATWLEGVYVTVRPSFGGKGRNLRLSATVHSSAQTAACRAIIYITGSELSHYFCSFADPPVQIFQISSA